MIYFFVPKLLYCPISNWKCNYLNSYCLRTGLKCALQCVTGAWLASGFGSKFAASEEGGRELIQYKIIYKIWIMIFCTIVVQNSFHDGETLWCKTCMWCVLFVQVLREAHQSGVHEPNHRQENPRFSLGKVFVCFNRVIQHQTFKVSRSDVQDCIIIASSPSTKFWNYV